MTDGHIHHKDEIFLDRVADPVVPNSNPVSGASTQPHHSWGSWILGQECDRAPDPILVARINVAQCSLCSGSKLDPIHQVQPRSALT
jgi:hypothetical protein